MIPHQEARHDLRKGFPVCRGQARAGVTEFVATSFEAGEKDVHRLIARIRWFERSGATGTVPPALIPAVPDNDRHPEVPALFARASKDGRESVHVAILRGSLRSHLRMTQ